MKWIDFSEWGLRDVHKKLLGQIVSLFCQSLSAFNSVDNGRLEKSYREPKPMPQRESFHSFLYPS